MSITKDGLLNLMGNEESQQFMKSMESDDNNLFASLEPESAKIEAFLNDIEGEIANGTVKDAIFAKGYLEGLQRHHDLQLTHYQETVWLNKLMGVKKLDNSSLSGAHASFPTTVYNKSAHSSLLPTDRTLLENDPDHELHIEDYPTLLVPEDQESFNVGWPALNEKLKGGFKKGEMVILGGGNVGQQHMRGLNFIDEVPFIVSSEIEPNRADRHGNDFIIRNYDAEIPELQAFDSKDRNRVVDSERKVLTPNQRNKRKAKNKAASVARRKLRK